MEDTAILSKDKALLLARAVEGGKASNPLVLEVKELCSYTDYLVICSGHSDRQVRALADRVLEALEESDLQKPGVEGYEKSHWILIDSGDVVVHVFYEPARAAYDLETLWLDAPRIDIDTGARKAPARGEEARPGPAASRNRP